MMKLVRLVLLLVLVCPVPSLAASPAVSGAEPAPAGSQALPAPVSSLSLEREFPGESFDESIPTPAQHLGRAPGEAPTRHAALLAYFERLASASPRAALETYATTHEGRRLIVLAVGDEATIARLEGFRAQHARAMDPRTDESKKALAALAESKAVAWMAYGIHGDELSSSDAAMLLAYYLVAGQSERAQEMRERLLVLIDPCENPDGRERFLAQTAAFAHNRPNTDVEDLSHTNVWPWGRGNHYLFDLNRDWFTMVQPESRRSELIASWNPQLMVDSHEMGPYSTYLFSPARHPFNPHRPAELRAWAERFSTEQARALDRRGYGYYTGEWNEEFFPGYGSSWAAYRGAVGILYEMSQTDGTRVTRRSGEQRSFAQAVEHQLTSSMANLTSLLAHRTEVLRDFVEGRARRINEAAESAVRAWVLPRDLHPERVDRLVSQLLRQGIEVSRLAAPARAEKLVDIVSGESSARTLAAGSYLVRTDQPAGPLVRALLDPHVPMEPAFLREEREWLERERGSRLYETTSWSLPLAYGIDAYHSGRLPPGDWRPATAPSAGKGGLTAEGEVFAYLVDGASDRSRGLLAELLQQRLRVRVARDRFKIGGREFAAGSLALLRRENPADLARRVDAAGRRWSVDVFGTDTADSEDGPDLGGGRFDLLVEPRVGVLAGMPISPSSYGAVWHLLDEELDLRFTAIDAARFGRVDLARYNVLVIPQAMGGEDAYRAIVGKEGLERLKTWLRAGGTLVAFGGSAQFFAREESGLSKVRPLRQVLDRFPPQVLGLDGAAARRAGWRRATGLAGSPDAAVDPYAVRPVIGPGAVPFSAQTGTLPAGLDAPVSLEEWVRSARPEVGKGKLSKEVIEAADARLRRFRPRGAFLLAELDRDSWLARGLPAELPVWVRASDALIAEPPVRVVARLAAPPRVHLGGLLWPEAAARWAHTAYLTQERVGRGEVILFLSEPEFRGLTLGTRRLLTNALLLGPGLGARWSTPW